MKHSHSKDFQGGGRPHNQLLNGLKTELSGLKCKNKLREIRGFSLGDALIAMAVIGALALILLPSYKAVNPDKSEALHKKATFIVERVVNELVTDEYLYPSGGEYSGFSNTSGVTLNGENHTGITKFCTLFTSRLNLKPGTEVNCTSGNISATSAEGIDWYIPISDFKNGAETLIADVNGVEGPNCTYSENCPKPDRFEYKIEGGTKVPVKEVQYYAATGNPPPHGGAGGDKAATSNDRPGLERYAISCQGAGGGSVTGATIYGQGDGKINGNYILVAIPDPGYRCSWFTHQVTVDNGPVTDCAITCTKDLERPTKDGGDVYLPPGDDDDDEEGGEEEEEEKSYCINIELTGESDKCTVEGAGCGKLPGIYTVTVSAVDASKYTSSWSSKSFTIVDSDINETVLCSASESCYNLTVTGADNCEIKLPSGNCKGNSNKYTNGKYTIEVTPKEGFTYGGKTREEGASTYDVEINGSDVTANIVCTTAPLCPNPATAVITLTPTKNSGGNGYYMSADVSLSHDLPVDVALKFNGRDDKGTTFGGTFNIPSGATSATINAGGNTSGTYGGTIEGTFESADPGECITGVTIDAVEVEPNKQVDIDVTFDNYAGNNLGTGDGGKVSGTYTIVGYSVSSGNNPVMKIDHSYTCVNTKTGEQKSSGGIGGAGKYCTSYTYTPGNSNFAGEQCHGSINSCSITVDGHTFNCTTGTYEYDGVTYNVKRIETSGLNVSAIAELQECSRLINGGGSCSIGFIGTGVLQNTKADVQLSGGSNESFTLDSSNSYRKTLSDMPCGNNYQITATGGVAPGAGSNWADAVITATANPSSITNLSGSQTVWIEISDESPEESCTIEVVAAGDTSKNAYCSIHLTGNEVKNDSLSKSNSYKVIWENLECGKQYFVRATDGGNDTGPNTVQVDANPTTINSLTGTQTVTVTFGNSGPPLCGINLTGSGDTGGGVQAKVSLSGGTSRSVVLSSSNSYKHTWNDLECGKAYTISVSDAKDITNSSAKITATASPSSFSSLSDSQNVDVNFKKEVQSCKLTIRASFDYNDLINSFYGNLVIPVTVFLNGSSQSIELHTNAFSNTIDNAQCGTSYNVKVGTLQYDSSEYDLSYTGESSYQNPLKADTIHDLYFSLKRKIYVTGSTSGMSGSMNSRYIDFCISSWPEGISQFTLNVTGGEYVYINSMYGNCQRFWTNASQVYIYDIQPSYPWLNYIIQYPPSGSF